VSVHVSFNMICDRCGKPYDMQSVPYAQGLPKLNPEPWVLTRKGVEVFRFEDLCTGCESVVSGLVDRIQLVEDKKKSKKDNGSKTDGSEKTDQPKKEVTAGVQVGTDDDRPF